MRSFVTLAARHAAIVSASALVALVALVAPSTVLAQGIGTIAGRVADSSGHGLPAAVSLVGNTRYGAYAGSDGAYVLTNVPAGSYRLAAHFIGFRADTVAVTVNAGQTVRQNIALVAAAATLNTVVISSPRLNETQAGALQEQKNAENIVSVMSGDEMRSLPNYNVAEALARMPGVTAERDEGEGKFVEIRGTPPQFQHVTIDGADVPGTLRGDRSVKLDDVPADVLGAIEVHKTLSADMDAGAIGGSVNLVTKIPEGTPRGYASGYYGYQTLESNNNGHGDLSYGGRVGADQKLGFLIDGSLDRTNRVINDVEPSWSTDVAGAGYGPPTPAWSEREYDYYRTRYGIGSDLDYRFSPTSSVYIKGLWSAFFDEANRWATGIAGGSVSPFYSNRGPIEHTLGFTGGGKHEVGRLQLAWGANYAGSNANQHDHYDDSYSYIGPALSPGVVANRLAPRPVFSQGDLANLANPNYYQLTRLSTDNERTNGSIIGAHADAMIPYELGTLPLSTKFGIKVQNQHKGYFSFQPSYTPNGTLLLSQFLSNYSAPSFYSHVCAGCYPLAPFGSLPAVNENLVHNPAGWTMQSNGFSDTMATFAGTEQVNAAYAMQTVDIGRLHVNAGLRVENTTVGYVGHGDTTLVTNGGADTTDALLSHVIHGRHSYTDAFPSLQLKYTIGENTNLRAAVTRGIARPNYSSLAPSLSAFQAVRGALSNPISIGNPDLKPEYAWNYDLLAEHYFSSVGVLSGGVFYKDITNFIFNHSGLYSGPFSQYAGFYAATPQNGPSATLWGAELDYVQHLTFLPGFLQGLGFDVNWTHVESRAIVPLDSATYGQSFRHAPIPRQFPNLFNASVLYDYAPLTARISGEYTSASVYSYGNDGTSNPATGDNWNYSHFQLDAALSYTVFRNDAITLQALNLTNSVFGFFNGTTRNAWNVQREYYGTTFFVGYRKGF